MSKHVHDKNDQIKDVIKSIQNVAKKLNKTPTINEYKKSEPSISYDVIQYLFGSWNEAIIQSQLNPNPLRKPPDNSYSKEKVVKEIIKIANEIGMLPSGPVFQAKSIMSTGPVKRIFGSWVEALDYINKNCSEKLSFKIEKKIDKITKEKKELLGLASPLKYKPRNEQETIILFCLLAKELGYSILKAQTEFPDLLLEYSGKEIQAEFEFLSSNYQKHGHSINDKIICVCWRKDKNIDGLTIIDLESVVRNKNTAPNTR